MQTGAEDPNKVKKLVETPGMQALWDNMYSTIYSDMQNSGILTKNEVKVELDLNDIAMRKQLMQNLPKRLQSEKIVGVPDNNDSILQGSELLRTELANIVAPAAKSQSIKGFFSAGVAKSFKYAMAKLAKGRLKK
jgi:regulatory protein YycI of two-component signal transduction system YycFG